ncbi:hypothetical protein HNR23_002593 [Nocardiopsis mwathae]|uniref:Uncharacterized protein n=1 Tax=Nocardiopsis mwathae TaxID=1472723 RepID=A0A7X0D5R1_9ACTN|nr:hypothetical protein [Nocardiopsis mwathae]MBB6172533.1 hypothetical protein [Nocardiopsis mwathae]
MSAGNPFPVSPVAKVSDYVRSSPDWAVIETDAFRSAISCARDFRTQVSGVARGADASPLRASRALAVVGDYGTGKTRLVVEALRYLHHERLDSHRIIAMSAAGADFVDLYRQFLKLLAGPEHRGQLRHLVTEHLRDVVVDHLRGGTLTRQVAEHLQDSDIDVVSVIENLGLPLAALLERLRAELTDVVGDHEMGTVLAALIEPTVRAQVWRWLDGGDPCSALRDRSVGGPIDTPGRALAAMTALVRLYRSRGWSLTLAIDEMHLLLDDHRAQGPPDPPEAGPARAADAPTGEASTGYVPMDHGIPRLFKRFLEDMISPGTARGETFVIMSGLPDLLHLFPADVAERISTTVTMAPFDERRTRDLIRTLLSLEHPAGERDDGIAPFEEATLADIVRFTGGQVRRILLLCRSAYQAVDEDASVSLDVLRDMAREQFSYVEVRDTFTTAWRLFGEQGWRAEAREGDPADPDGSAAIWLPLPEREETGCLVMFQGPVLDDADVCSVQERIDRALPSLGTGAQDRAAVRVLLVVNGYVARPLQKALQGRVDLALPYRHRRFADHLARATRHFREELGRKAAVAPTAGVVERLAELSAQQHRAQELLNGLTTVLDQVRTEQQRTAQRSRAAIESRGQADITLPAVREAPTGYSRIGYLIDQVHAELREVAKPQRVRLREAFRHQVYAPTGTVMPRWHTDEAITQVTSASWQMRTGLLLVLEETLLAFAESVYTVLRAADQDDIAPPRRALRQLCDQFTEVVECLTRELPPPDPASPVSTTSTPEPHDDFTLLLRRLGDNVFDKIFEDDFRRRW